MSGGLRMSTCVSIYAQDRVDDIFRPTLVGSRNVLPTNADIYLNKHSGFSGNMKYNSFYNNQCDKAV